MLLLKSANRLAAVCILIAAGCGHGRGKKDRDSSIDPVQGDGGVTCSPDTPAESGCSVAIEAELNECPNVSFEASPVRARVDLGVRVASMSVDPEGDAMTYVWSSEPDGFFDDPAGLVTQYRCESIGRKTLILTVLDSRGCDSVGELEVTCVDLEDFMRSAVQVIASPP